MGTALTGAALLALAPRPAHAANEACGAPVNGTVSCAPQPGNYPDGISYAPVQDLTVTLQQGATVETTSDTTAGIRVNSGTTAAGVVVNGAVNTAGTFAPGVYAFSNDGAVSVSVSPTGSITTSGDTSDGIDAIGFGEGTVSATVAGGASVSTSGAGAAGIVGFNFGGGDVSIDVADGASVTTSGRGSDAILATTTTGDLTIHAGTLTVSGDASRGITANSSSGTISITAGDIRTAGSYSDGINADNYSGDTSITVDSVTATGAYYTRGISATNTSGSVEITAGHVSTSGDFYSDGLFVHSYGGTATVTVGEVAVAGDYSTGITTVAVGDASVTVNNGVTTQGYASDGIYAVGLASATVVNKGEIVTQGDHSRGIYAASYGDVTVSGSGSVSTSGSSSTGIEALSYYGGVSVTQGSVATSGDDSDGIDALALGLGGTPAPVSVTVGTVSTAGTNSAGIQAVSNHGDVTVTAGSVTTLGDDSPAIVAVSKDGNVTVTATGTVSTGTAPTAANPAGTGANATGIYAYSYTGSVTVNANTVATKGDQAHAIYANGIDTSVTVSGAISTAGERSYGVLAVGYTGSASATVNDVATLGDDSTAVFVHVSGGSSYGGAETLALAPGDALATVNGTVTTAGDFAAGVVVTSDTGTASVVNNGSIRTAGEDSIGVYAFGPAGVSISGDGSVRTTGDYSIGIGGRSPYGPVSIAAGSVETTGFQSDGVVGLSRSGPVTIDVGSVKTSGDQSVGIKASHNALYSNDGDVSITAGSVATSGAGSDGIEAYSHAGDVTVSAGQVNVSGSGSRGIYAESYFGAVSVTGAAKAVDAPAILAGAYNGSVSVTVTGATESTHGNAVVAYGYTGTAVEVTAAGSVKGGINAIVISTPSLSGGGGGEEDRVTALAVPVSGQSIVVNAGTVTGGTGYAVYAVGAPVTVTNSGTINGALRLTENDDSVVNTATGRFNASKDSDFGAGDDSFVNAGTLTVTGTDVTFLGLETFRNSGAVTLANNRLGDRFILPGDFVGAGGTLALDVALGSSHPAYDQLVIGGAATGSTGILLHNAGTAAPVLLAAGDKVTLATAGAGSSAGAFTAAPATQNQGFIHYEIVPVAKAGGGTDYDLIGEAGAPVFRTIKILEGAQSLWYKSADAVSAHATGLRDAIWSGGTPTARGLWIQAFGSVDTRKDALGGYDVSYRQDYFGGQIGADFGTLGDKGGLVFGATGGYISSKLNFTGSPDRASYEAFNLGLTASYVSGGLFLNGLAKYDFYRIRSTGAEAGYFDKLHGKGYGVQGEIGYRFGSDRFFAEPVASLAFVRTDLDDLAGANAVVDFDKMDGLRGKLGLRAGGSAAIGASKGVFYAGASYVREFEGKDGITFLSGAYAPHFDNRRIQGYVQGTLGVTVTMPSGVSGFIEANGDASKHYKGGGGRVGLSLKF
ncbi:autotransporter outer membrane beta-barrel domain-containing protein [Flavisphingomonas formosensis]|uniref:autotransporter outer membrane beta-barrel domain-containing protein n=1 Tax=Flavisphingomonas formosensis TaxID=861534 RepID=UPI0012FB835C|nr:autotransporter outer membrane beta-barrel domain-containing protein [Sphingomonas formosensis]